MDVTYLGILIAWAAAASAFLTALFAKRSEKINRPVLLISSAKTDNGRLVFEIENIGGRAAKDILLIDGQHRNATGHHGLGAGRECILELPDEGNSYVDLQLQYRDVDGRKIREPLSRFRKDGQGPSLNFEAFRNERGFLRRFLPRLIR